MIQHMFVMAVCSYLGNLGWFQKDSYVHVPIFLTCLGS